MYCSLSSEGSSICPSTAEMLLPVFKEPSKILNLQHHLAQKRLLKASSLTINLAKFNGAVYESTSKIQVDFQ